jgi:signal peptidase II
LNQIISEAKTQEQPIKDKNWNWFGISVIIILLDQISKYFVRVNIDYGDIVRVTTKFFWLTNIRNTGAAFSFSFGNASVNRLVFIVISSLAAILLIYLILKSKNRTESFAYALILGGALGNLIDRIFLGSVTDFLWCDFPDWIMHRWPVFNIADSSIVVAIVILILYTLFWEKKKVEDK